MRRIIIVFCIINLVQLGAYAKENSLKLSRLGAAAVPFSQLQWYLDNDFDLIVRVLPDSNSLKVNHELINSLLKDKKAEYYNYEMILAKMQQMADYNVPIERRGLKRGLGKNRYNNPDCVCGGWPERYKFMSEELLKTINESKTEGIVCEDFFNRVGCYCNACETDYRKSTGKSGFPHDIYETPHYEDFTSFDPDFIRWDQERLAKNVKIMADLLHADNKKIGLAGVSRWLVNVDTAKYVDEVMFYAYYSGRRLPPNYMRNWKYYHDHIVTKNLWIVMGYFREYHTFHTRLMLANLPEGIGIMFWPASRQPEGTDERDDALYARDVVSSRLVPIRIGVYDSSSTRQFRQSQQEVSERTKTALDKAVIGFQRLGFDATVISTLDRLNGYDLIYLEDVECLGQAEIDTLASCGVGVLATGLSGKRDETGKLWSQVNPSLPKAARNETTLNLPLPIVLFGWPTATDAGRRFSVETEGMLLHYPWFDFIFDTVSYTHSNINAPKYTGVKTHVLSVKTSRVYGEYLDNAIIRHYQGEVIAKGSEANAPMIVYDPQKNFTYSTIKFSDYVNVNDLSECGYGYEMRQFCFLQIIDAMTLPKRGVTVEPYLMTAIRKTEKGHFLTVGNPYDEPKSVKLILKDTPHRVFVNHMPYDNWKDNVVTTPLIGVKHAVQVHVEYE